MYDDEDYFDGYMDPDEEFNAWWNDPKNQVEHTCQACERKFKGHESRGPLAFCETCADKIERGEDLYY